MMKQHNTVLYAIGDVHGEADRLRALHAHILDKHTKRFPDKRIKIIHLGDYIDRGPDSFEVIEAIMKLQARNDVECICLLGNHEEMLLNAINQTHYNARDNWLENGGQQTLASYSRNGHADLSLIHI